MVDLPVLACHYTQCSPGRLSCPSNTPLHGPRPLHSPLLPLCPSLSPCSRYACSRRWLHDFFALPLAQNCELHVQPAQVSCAWPRDHPGRHLLQRAQVRPHPVPRRRCAEDRLHQPGVWQEHHDSADHPGLRGQRKLQLPWPDHRCHMCAGLPFFVNGAWARANTGGLRGGQGARQVPVLFSHSHITFFPFFAATCESIDSASLTCTDVVCDEAGGQPQPAAMRCTGSSAANATYRIGGLPATAYVCPPPGVTTTVTALVVNKEVSSRA